jgi:DNA topoisomerase-1
MSKYLVIVESPTKAKTIHAILGDDYEVTSSMGHVMDLPSSRLSVDIENDFQPDYKVIPGKEKIIKQLKKSAKKKEIIFIATDPDREGEAIGWNIKEKLADDAEVFKRVVFHEITAEALKEAFSKPEDFDINKINSQTARRVLDRIVGYHLSPLLWKKIVRGLSAGRVQSIALKFIVDREKEINSFVSKKTYTIEANFKAHDTVFCAKLEKYNGKKAIFETQEEANKANEEIKKHSFLVKEIIKKESKRNPPAPFITSLLQQDAFNKLRFSSQRTMMVAQGLYEGVQIGENMVGLITYMRTDSFAISGRAKEEANEFIEQKFGKNYIPEKEFKHKVKKMAQLAHEAIRPSSIHRLPEDMTKFLSEDATKLYDLIWRRFAASRMSAAIFENTKAIITSEHFEFSAEAKRLVFDGYLRAYGREDEDVVLPPLAPKQELTFIDCKVIEHTTKPPARFNDASLVKILEEKGIGRPSTYAPIIYTLVRRNYVRRERGYFTPTALGIKVSDLLSKYFGEIINEDFTALMEEKLDEVEEGKIEWHSILHNFFPSFKEKINSATSLITKEVEFSGKNCPQCQSPLVIKWSRKGRFLSCSKFPQCRYAESITTEVNCPQCKVGKLIERRNKRGQHFYGCSKFPDCRFTSRNLPDTETQNDSSVPNNVDGQNPKSEIQNPEQ